MRGSYLEVMKPTIRAYRDDDAGAFRQLNERWISQFFTLEAKDRETLEHPREKVLEPGGAIFVAEREGEIIGCCALLRTGEGELEVAKMAVDPRAQGLGIGRAILAHVIEAARAMGVSGLVLESSSHLTPAVTLYESMGFRHVPPERVKPSPFARADVFMELRF
jgi:ribosomal protein S18 acetylase RimI-like enzyme